MRKHLVSKILASIYLTVMALGCMPSLPVSAAQTEIKANSSHIEYKFKFGNSTTSLKGYTNVSAATPYTKEKGYGFNTPENMKDVTTSGTSTTGSAVQFLTSGTKSSNTFNVDVPDGLYEVKVTLGDTFRASVAAEGVYQIMNMTGNCAKDSFQIPISDGQLNILVTEGKSNTPFTLSTLEIKQISKIAITNKTVYIGGDSTVCNYYPLDSSKQAGWGQMLHSYVENNNYLTRNMATGGQFARGFRNDGQFEAIMKYIKPGDYLILQFGINDTNPKNCETEAEYKEIMLDMIKQVQATGASVILSAPQGRATDFNADNVHTCQSRWYRASTLALAKEENVPLVDLNLLSSAYFTSIGKDATLALYMTGDTLHPNREGATQLARLVAEDLKSKNLKLSKYIDLQ